MPDHKGRTRKPTKQRIPRISGQKAAKIFKECDNLLLQSGNLLANLPGIGFDVFLRALSADILQLALQPDSWGERTKARLMSDIAPALQGDMSRRHPINVDDIAHCANIVTPCLLLELGRRNQHVEIEFPSDPTDSSARFKFRVGKSYPVHSINNQKLTWLASTCGEDLVGLCYFGDQQSRYSIESELGTKHAA